MSVQVTPYVITSVVPFTTLETISLPVTGVAGTVPVSLGIGNTTAFLPLSSITGPGTAPAEAVIIDPATSARNVIQPTVGTAVPLTLKAQAGQSVRLLEWDDSTGALLGGVGPGGSCIFKGFASGVNAKAVNYTASGTDHTIPVNASAGPVTITLPPAAVATPFGLELLVIKIDASANAVTIAAAGGDTINGAATFVLPTQYDEAGLQADGSTAWYANTAVGQAGVVVLAPTTTARNTIRSTNVNAGELTLTAFPAQTVDVFTINGSADAGSNALTINSNVVAGNIVNVRDVPSGFQIFGVASPGSGSIAEAVGVGATDVVLQAFGGAGQSVPIFRVGDSAGTPTMDVGDAKIGFFNTPMVVRQANASQAAITAVIDGNAKSALQAIYSLLKNYGLAPATA